MRKTVLTFVVAAALVAAACGNDTDDSDGAPGTDAAGETAVPATTATADTSTTTGADPDTGTTATAGDDDAGSGGGAAEVTFDDSGRLEPAECAGEKVASEADGVTEDSVNVASLSIDWAPLADIGFAPTSRDPTEIFSVFADEINDNGGVCGRTIDVQQVRFNILAGEGGQACVEATEDRNNLAVGTYAYDEVLCLTGAGVPVIAGNDLTHTQMETANGLLFTRYPSAEDQYRATVQYALDDGALDGTVGVWYGSIYPETTAAVEDVVLPMLDDAGVDYTAFRTDAAGPTDPEGNAILTAAATAFTSERVDTVLMFVQNTNHTGMQTELNAQGIDPRYISMPISSNGANELFAERFGTTDIADGQQFVTFNDGYPELDDTDPIAAACHEIWTRRTGDEVPLNTFDYAAVAIECVQADRFAAAMSLAGGDLTRERFVEALEALPPHRSPPLLGDVDWAPDQRFGPAVFSVQDYDGSENLSVTRDDHFELDQ